ncbi:MAG: hypothetical protein QOG91_61 [Candidatus Parcubacteria bacterium]|jgi:hypothetical protein|nr:hypothetical protein [Candidatus Parcubacteria bacterium]
MIANNNHHGLGPHIVQRIIGGDDVKLIIEGDGGREHEKMLEDLRLWLAQIQGVQIHCLTTRRCDNQMELVVGISAREMKIDRRMAIAGRLVAVPLMIIEKTNGK